MSWEKQLRHLWWPDDEWVPPQPEVFGWLRSKYDVVKRLRPETLGEIGVRAGYSAFAMLSAAPNASFLGIDLQNPDQPGATDWARELLAEFQTMIVQVDSHAIVRFPPLDLVHVDGDHLGCFADLELLFRSGVRWALLDDYFTGTNVRDAVHKFVAAYAVDLVEEIDDGFRGSALLRLR